MELIFTNTELTTKKRRTRCRAQRIMMCHSNVVVQIPYSIYFLSKPIMFKKKSISSNAKKKKDRKSNPTPKGRASSLFHFKNHNHCLCYIHPANNPCTFMWWALWRPYKITFLSFLPSPKKDHQPLLSHSPRPDCLWTQMGPSTSLSLYFPHPPLLYSRQLLHPKLNDNRSSLSGLLQAKWLCPIYGVY